MERCHFLDLPTELRLEIIEHIFSDQSTTLTVGGCYSPSFAQSAPAPPAIFGGDLKNVQAQQPPISLVCRQLRKEALPLFYRQTRFLLALNYRKARTEVSKWIDVAAENPAIEPNLWNISIKHRFGILDFRGVIDFDFKNFRILGPHLWYNSIPPIYIREVDGIVDSARERERTEASIVDTLRSLIEVLGVAMPD